MGNIYRDMTLENLDESYIGKELKVAGWVENIRDHGGVSFIDLRDMYGVLQVVIRDTELLKGIKKEELNIIWDKYYKNEKNHKRNKVGTGVGLSIVKNILDKHNFKYGVKSEIGKGTTFYFEITKIS